MSNFLAVNQAYKKVHFYPYEPLRMQRVYLGDVDRFDRTQYGPLPEALLAQETRNYWLSRRDLKEEMPGKGLPKELFWLRLEMNPGRYRFCGPQGDVICPDAALAK